MDGPKDGPSPWPANPGTGFNSKNETGSVKSAKSNVDPATGSPNGAGNPGTNGENVQLMSPTGSQHDRYFESGTPKSTHSYPIGGLSPNAGNGDFKKEKLRPASAKSMADVLKSELMVCPICDKEMTAPKTLPCLHAFCEPCISSNVANLKDEDPHCQIRCPVCEIPVSNSRNFKDAKVFAETLPPSLFISSLLVQKQIKQKLCKPCNSAGKRTPADSWCAYCAETLCLEHLSYHNALTSPSIHHVFKIQQIEKNPQIIETSGKCTVHEHERVKYFCQDHKVACCETCWKSQHEMCDVESIELAASSIKNRPETTRLVGELEIMRTHTEHVLKDREKNLEDLEQQKRDEQNSLKEIRKQINEHLDKLESKTIADLDKAHRQKAKEIQQEMHIFEHKQQTVSFYKLLLESVLKNSSDVLALTELTKIRNQCKILEENLNHRISRLKRTDLIFVPNDLTKGMSRLGDVETQHRPITPPPSFEARQKHSGILTPRKLVATRRDKGSNFLVLRYSSSKITGGCSVKSSLVLVDNRGKEIRGYSVDGHREDKQVYSFKSESEANPFDVTMLPPRRSTTILVTTIPLKNRLQVIEFGDGRNEKGVSYKTNGRCYGISYMDGYVIVACMSKLEIWRIDEDYNLMFERSVFTKGDHVSYVHAVDNRIYYTDSCEKGSVTCTTLDGTDIFTYSHHNLRMPMGVVVDNTGNIFVAAYYSNNVHVLNLEGSLMKVTSPKESHFSKPVFLIVAEGKIFVTYDKHKITSLY